MVGQIIEIATPGHWLNKARGFLEVSRKGEKVGQVPLDDIAAIIIAAPGCSLSTNLLEQLAQRNIPIITCGQNYLPTTWTLPLQGHNRQFQIMRAQIALSEPRRKRAWQQIVRAKIRHQAEVLERAGQPNKHLLRLVGKVRSGDPENCEAQAARLYWQHLFGSDFRRNRDAPGMNAALNYGYTVVRACVARGVCGAGLHPSFSLHHKNPQNAFNLVDDLVEALRPVVDLVLRMKFGQRIDKLDVQAKAALAAIVTLPAPMDDEYSPLSVAAAKMCRSLANYCLGDVDSLLFPALPSPLEVAAK